MSPGNATPWEDFGGTGPLLCFAHANGFPPGSYRSFFEPLASRFRVVAIRHRALWSGSDPGAFGRWSEFADDLLWTLDQISPGEPAVAIGHSLGAAIAAFAAARAPERFRALVLVEPVFLLRRYLLLTRLTPKRVIPMVKAALRRRDRWPDADAVFASFRHKPLFRGISDEVLRDCVGAMVRPDGAEVTLTFPKAWEAAIFATPPWPWPPLARLEPPTLAVRAAHSNTLFPAAWARWKRLQPRATFAEVPDTGHLVPLQAPGALADRVLSFLATLEGAP